MISSARSLAWLAICAGTALGAGACRDVVAGSANDLVADLCDTLSACTGACPGRVSDAGLDRESQLDDATWADLLDYDTRIDCASSCSSARKCLDHAPFCGAPNDSCESDDACCRSTVGLARCDGDSGACCASAGATCTPGEDDTCCGDAPCAANGRCGGVVCTLTRDEVGDDASACVSSFECCSNRCDGGHCVAFSCARLAEPCKVDTDCCSGTSATGEVVQPRCDATTGTCVDDDETTCDFCKPVETADNCCLATNEFCYVLVDGTSTCGGGDCAPLGGDCSADSDCCTIDGAPGHCETTGVPHCTVPLPGCQVAGTPCMGDAECCSGACAAGVCTLASDCSATECRSACQLGAPLSPLDAACGNVDAACLSVVCAVDPACCCQEWSAGCRLAYQEACGPCM